MTVGQPHDDRRPCSVEGCTKNAGVLDLCRRHQYDWVKRQTTDGVRTGGRPKLTEAQVAEARRMRAAFVPRKDIAKHLGVSVDTVWRYLRGDRKAAS